MVMKIDKSLFLKKQDSFIWTVNEIEIMKFAEISGDYNPIHIKKKIAVKRGFDNKVVHGFLLGAKLSYFLGMILPGNNCLILEQKITFHNPIYPDEKIKISGIIVQMNQDLRIVDIKIDVKNIITSELKAKGKALCKILS